MQEKRLVSVELKEERERGGGGGKERERKKEKDYAKRLGIEYQDLYTSLSKRK